MTSIDKILLINKDKPMTHCKTKTYVENNLIILPYKKFLSLLLNYQHSSNNKGSEHWQTIYRRSKFFKILHRIRIGNALKDGWGHYGRDTD